MIQAFRGVRVPAWRAARLDTRTVVYVAKRRQPKPESKPPKPPQPGSTHILDSFFSEPREVLTDNYGAGLPYVTPETEFADRYQAVRGVYSIFVEHMYSRQLVSAAPRVYSCEYFSAWFFPAWHFVSSGRKSRPSVLCLYGKGAENNGVAPTGPVKPNAFKRSRNPFAYAVWRNYMSKSARRSLFSAFETELAAGTNPALLDGTYMVRSLKVAKDPSQLDPHMTKMMQNVKAMTSNPKSLEWVEKVNQRVDFKQLNALLRKNFLPPVSRQSALDWRPR